MKHPKKNAGPIVIDMKDLSSQDLAGGYVLKFQRSTTEPTKVRCVIKSQDGSIYAKGEVVEESNAFASRVQALSNSKKRTWLNSIGLQHDPPPTKEQEEEAYLRTVEKLMGPIPPDWRRK